MGNTVFVVRTPGVCCLCGKPLTLGEYAVHHAAFVSSKHGTRAHIPCKKKYNNKRKEDVTAQGT